MEERNNRLKAQQVAKAKADAAYAQAQALADEVAASRVVVNPKDEQYHAIQEGVYLSYNGFDLGEDDPRNKENPCTYTLKKGGSWAEGNAYITLQAVKSKLSTGNGCSINEHNVFCSAYTREKEGFLCTNNPEALEFISGKKFRKHNCVGCRGTSYIYEKVDVAAGAKLGMY